MWTLIQRDKPAKDVIEERFQRERSDNPLIFLCLAVARHGGDDNNFSHVDHILSWVRDYRSLEEAEIHRRTVAAAYSGKGTLSLIPAHILVLVDPINPIAQDTWKERQRREKLVETGVILLPRHGVSADNDTLRFAKVVDALKVTDILPQAGLGAPQPVLPRFLDWKVTPPPKDAAIYGNQPAHTEFPENEKLKEIFETYNRADWRDLDY